MLSYLKVLIVAEFNQHVPGLMEKRENTEAQLNHFNHYLNCRFQQFLRILEFILMQCSSEGMKVNLAKSSKNNCLQLLIQITRQFSLQIRIYLSLGPELNVVCALIDEPAGV